MMDDNDKPNNKRAAAVEVETSNNNNNIASSKKPQPQREPSKNASGKKSRQPREPLIATPADVFVKHPYLFVPFLDRVSLNRLFSTNKEIHAEASSRAVTLPWPEKRFQVGLRVYSVAFSPDGGLLACGCHNGRIHIWNRSNGRCMVLEGHTNCVSSLTFSPDGNFLACATSWDRTFRLWKLADSSYRVFEGHTDSVMSVAFSPDGSTISSGSFDGSVRIWDVSDRRCFRNLRDNRMLGVNSIAWSPDGATIAAADHSGPIFLWDITNDENIVRAPVIIDGHEGAVFSISYSPDGRYLASGFQDKTVKLGMLLI
jgi:WD40 repeat protein